jgi:uncharacterized MAPEG superfamily protein
MTSMTDSIRAFVWCVGLLVFKMIFVIGYTVYQRYKTQSPASPEDENLLGGDGSGQPSKEVARAQAIHRNDLENIPMFFMVAIIFGAACFGEDYYPAASMAFYIIFLISRYAHMIFYMFALQPWRAIAFQIGIFMNVLYGFWAMVVVLMDHSNGHQHK